MKNLIDRFLMPYRNARIAIYGTGLNAERVLGSVQGYLFECVISNDGHLIGTDFFGREVLTLQEAIHRADIILIAAIPAATRIVFERIKHDVPDRIKIFDLSGNQLNAPRQYENHDYWNATYRDLISAIDGHEVISFDVFDTLLMRKCLYPATVFKMVEERAAGLLGKRAFLFSLKRREAEHKLYSEGRHPTIHEIYGRMGKDCGISESDCIRLLEQEILQERGLMARREDMYQAYRYALEKKKKIYITSDMYLTKELIDRLLSEQGITQYQDLLVSCEYGCSKADGGLFAVLKKAAASDDILHVGDNSETDISGAGRAGMDAFPIWSALDILLNSSAAQVIGKVENVWDELMLGHILSDVSVFNSPFEMGMHTGKISIDSVEMLTELCFLPITMAYMAWLIRRLQGKAGCVVLFASRDGYLLEKIYKNIRRDRPELNLPESKYFYTSRKAMSEVIPVDEYGIEALCANLDHYRKIEMIKHLERLFGIALRNELKQYEGMCFGEIDKNQLMRDLMGVKEKISAHADACRKGYLEYIRKLELDRFEDVYLVDLVAQGSSRYGLSRLCKKEVTLLALGTAELPNLFIAEPHLAESMYGGVVTGVGSAVGAMFTLLEMGYASGEGQLIGFTEDGAPLFDDATEYNKGLLERVQGKILSFIDSYVDKDWFPEGLPMICWDYYALIAAIFQKRSENALIFMTLLARYRKDTMCLMMCGAKLDPEKPKEVI